MDCWNSFLNKLNKARALRAGERWILAQAAVLVLASRVALRLVGWRRWHALLATGDAFSWDDTKGDHADLLFGKRPVMRYVYKTLDESTKESREQTFKVF